MPVATLARSNPAIADAFTALAAELGAAAVLVGDAVPERNANDNSAQAPLLPITVLRPIDAPDQRRSARDSLLAYAQ